MSCAWRKGVDPVALGSNSMSQIYARHMCGNCVGRRWNGFPGAVLDVRGSITPGAQVAGALPEGQPEG